ncbi:MAG: endonuclease VII domain-containing protein [Isosphaeraceae bacterium]
MKPIEMYSRNRNARDGHSSRCKDCHRAYCQEWNQRPEVKKRAAENALARYHRLNADEKASLQQRRYYLGRHLLKKYGMTLEDYEVRLAAQGGGCAICGKPPRDGRRLAVDHDHNCCPTTDTCGHCVRGLLCTTCNVWLGFYESAEWRSGAETYLQREIDRRLADDVSGK